MRWIVFGPLTLGLHALGAVGADTGADSLSIFWLGVVQGLAIAMFLASRPTDESAGGDSHD
jgi:hypothetical protein